MIAVPAAGGKPRILTAGLPNGGFPSVSRDGRWVYFTVLQNSEPRIWKVPAGGGPAIQVTNNAGTLSIESYDGRELYYVSSSDRPGSLWRQPLAGGDGERLVDGVIGGNFDVVDRGLYYIDRASGESGTFSTDRLSGATRLRYFDFATRRSTTVAHDLGPVGSGISASRDGRTVYFWRVDSSVDELMVVDDFR